MLVVARVGLARSRSPTHRHDDGIAALQKVVAVGGVARLVVVTPADAGKRAVSSPCRLHEPLDRSRPLGAVVEDEFVVAGADREWLSDLGSGVEMLAVFVA